MKFFHRPTYPTKTPVSSCFFMDKKQKDSFLKRMIFNRLIVKKVKNYATFSAKFRINVWTDHVTDRAEGVG